MINNMRRHRNIYCGGGTDRAGSDDWSRFGTTVTAADFRVPADPRFVLNSFRA